MPKGKRGTGYKRKRGNSYQIQVYKPDGSRHYETVHGPEHKANKRIGELQTDIDRGDFIEPSKLTFYQYLISDFLPHIKADKPGGYDEYNCIIENHIKNDPLGRMKLTDITNREATAYKLRKLDSNRIDGRPGKLSPKTVKNHTILIKSAFNYACELGMFTISPVQYLKHPDIPDFDPIVFTDDQACQFIQAAMDNKLFLFFLLDIYTGLRQGELRAIRWSDINFDRCLIALKQQVRGSGDKAVFKNKLKTKGSKTSVPFDRDFIPLFEDRRKEQMKEMEKCAAIGEKYREHHLVFTSYNGNPLDRKVIERNFGYICKAAGVPKIRLHDLRHSCATLLLGEGVPLRVVQERLRHTDIRMTEKYSHVLPKMQQEANEKMNRVLKFRKVE